MTIQRPDTPAPLRSLRGSRGCRAPISKPPQCAIFNAQKCAILMPVDTVVRTEWSMLY